MNSSDEIKKTALLKMTRNLKLSQDWGYRYNISIRLDFLRYELNLVGA